MCFKMPYARIICLRSDDIARLLSIAAHSYQPTTASEPSAKEHPPSIIALALGTS